MKATFACRTRVALGISAALLALCSSAAATNAPVATPPAVTKTAGGIALALPGTLTGLKASVSEIVANKPLTFKLEGSGYCQGKFATGDGSYADFNGDLPLTLPYTYSTSFMSSFDTFKDVDAVVTPSGNCKASSVISAKVRVVNPTPQSAGGAGNKATGVVLPNPVNIPVVAGASSGKLTSIKQVLYTDQGTETWIEVNGTGICAFTITGDAPPANFSTSAAKPFPIKVKIPNAPVGSHLWTAKGTGNCTGQATATFNVSG